MAAAPRPPKVQVFKSTALMDDAAAEAEELGEGTPVVEPEAPAQPAPVQEPGAEPKPEGEPPAPPEGEPQQESRAEKRIRQLLERNAEQAKELTEQRERWARLDERQKQAREAREAAERAAQQQREAAERPDPAIDPVGAQLWDTRRELQELRAWREQAQQQLGQFQQGYQQDQDTANFNNWLTWQANEFTRQQPDYPQAVEHAAKWRLNFWEQLGLPPTDPSDNDAIQGKAAPKSARAVVLLESQLIGRISQASGKSFAPLLYQLAQNVGYQSPQAANGNGVVAPAEASKAGRILSQVAKGQAVQGLSRAPATGNAGKSRYRDMTNAEIAAVPDKIWARDWENPELRAEMDYALKRNEGIADQDDLTFDRRR